MNRSMVIVKKILFGSLIVALICSMYIAYSVYVMRNTQHQKIFSVWQMPMIFAILGEMYLLM